MESRLVFSRCFFGAGWAGELDGWVHTVVVRGGYALYFFPLSASISFFPLSLGVIGVLFFKFLRVVYSFVWTDSDWNWGYTSTING